MKKRVALFLFLFCFSLSAQAIDRNVYGEAFGYPVVEQMEKSAEFKGMLKALGSIFNFELNRFGLYGVVTEKSPVDIKVRQWLESLAGRGGADPIPVIVSDLFSILLDALIKSRSLSIAPTTDLYYGNSVRVTDQAIAFLGTLPADRAVRVLNVGPGHGLMEMKVFSSGLQGGPFSNLLIDSVDILPNVVKLFNNVTKPFLASLDVERSRAFTMVQGNILDGLPAAFRMHTYDAVVALGVIHFLHPRTWVEFFGVVAASLRPGGSVLLSTRNIEAPYTESREKEVREGLLRVYAEQKAAGSPMLGFVKTVLTVSPESAPIIEVAGLSETETSPIAHTSVVRSGERATSTSISVQFDVEGFGRLLRASMPPGLTVEWVGAVPSAGIYARLVKAAE